MKREARLLLTIKTVTDLTRKEGAEIPHQQAHVCF